MSYKINAAFSAQALRIPDIGSRAEAARKEKGYEKTAPLNRHL